MSSLDHIPPIIKNGDEPLTFQDKNLNYQLLDFWQWSVSDILSNGTRGRLAEFIVATATNIDIKQVRDVEGPLAQMIMGAEILVERFDLDWYRSTNETQFTTMIAVVGRWRQRYADDFHIIHDNTSNFLRRREDWEAITNPTVPEQLHPLGDGTTVQFPLRVIDTVGVDSADNYAIQLCDILAGFSTQHFKQKWSGKTDHPIQLIAEEIGLWQLSHSGMMFEQDFPDGDPQRADGPDAVDLMTKIITGNNNV